MDEVGTQRRGFERDAGRRDGVDQARKYPVRFPHDRRRYARRH
jgi:hypothetical protein